jgi:hypothetical protein
VRMGRSPICVQMSLDWARSNTSDESFSTRMSVESVDALRMLKSSSKLGVQSALSVVFAVHDSRMELYYCRDFCSGAFSRK